ncbi:MAG: nicotinate phosphoribosyltransferase [Cyclobacteriaceae bacterium]
MNVIQNLYRQPLGLLTDFYQLTMAYGYWKQGLAQKESVFHLFFRRNPYQGGFTITAGLEYVIDYLNGFAFNEQDLDYLRSLHGNDGKPMFEPAFLDYLKKLEFNCQVDAIPEGTLVFPQEPLIRVQGEILQCQLLETPLLNMINFQSLIATKAARISLAAQGEPVMEFGLRRSQGIDGALSASRAAFIGGCSSTSNVLAGKLFGIPVSGTHAHSWVMSFENELESFKAYAEALPNNCIFLVDTYDTLQGVKNAIEVGKALKAQGKQMAGIRIDSGDLAYFSTKARELLDQAGFDQAKIVASNNLDENIVTSLKDQDAAIDTWGIGTKLVTAFDQPALGAVYKLSAIKTEQGQWDYKIKLSEQAVKVNNPGVQQVRRFRNNNSLVADMIYDQPLGVDESRTIIDPMDATKRRSLSSEHYQHEDLLQPVFRDGKQVYQKPDIKVIKQRVIEQIQSLDKGIQRFVNPHTYPVGLEQQLYDLKTKLIFKLRNINT